MPFKKIFLTVFILSTSVLTINVHAQTNGTVEFNGIAGNTTDTLCANSSGFMTLVGASSTPAYWQISFVGCTAPWTPIANTNVTNTYFMIQNNICYRAWLVNGDSSACGCLTVDAVSDGGVISGANAQCVTASGTLSVASVVGTPVGWYSSPNGVTYTPLGSAASTYPFSGVTSTTYYAYIAQNGVCPPDTSIDTLVVDQLSNAGIPSPNTGVCATGNSGNISVLGSNGAGVAWESSTDAGLTWSPTGYTSTSMPYLNLTANTWYQYITINGSCPPDTAGPVIITVDQPSIAGTLTGGGNFCGTPAIGTLSISGSTATSYQYQVAPSPGGPWTNNNACMSPTCNYNSPPNPTFYHVIVTNGGCPSDTSNIDSVLYSPNSVAGTLTASTDTVCAFSGGGTMNLTGDVGNDYTWQASSDGGTTWITYTVFTGPSAAFFGLPAGDYILHCIVANNFCSGDTSNPIMVHVNPSPAVNIINNDTSLAQGATIAVTAVGTGVPTWTPTTGVSATGSFNTNITAVSNIDYVITVDDGSGCTNSDTLRITLLQAGFNGVIANTLTPNGDGINDEFYIENIQGFTTSDLKVFNEYGQLVYSAAPYKNDWKGTYNNSRLPDGTYYYVLQFSDSSKIYKGNITLLSQSK